MSNQSFMYPGPERCVHRLKDSNVVPTSQVHASHMLLPLVAVNKSYKILVAFNGHFTQNFVKIVELI